MAIDKIIFFLKKIQKCPKFISQEKLGCTHLNLYQEVIFFFTKNMQFRLKIFNTPNKAALNTCFERLSITFWCNMFALCDGII